PFVEYVQTGQGIWIVLGLVLASGAGLPLPAPPILLAAGVLAGAGRISLAAVLVGSLVALLATDLLWYQLGRWRGRSILSFLCRISLEPDSCVQRTEDLFSRYRGGALLISKFLPGLKTAAPPLAGMIEMPLGEFALYGGAGSLLWAAAFAVPGYLFSESIARDRDVVLYCACPNEGSAAQMALLLRARGFRSARPLLGGIDAWRARGYPVEQSL